MESHSSPLYQVAVSVRELVHFVMLSGSLERGLGFVEANQALEGTRGHQHIQTNRPEGYEAEVSLRHIVKREALHLTIRGRVDGVWKQENAVVIEEIKTKSGRHEMTASPVHWAQGKVYAYIYLQEHPLETIDVQLTYLSRRTYEIQTYRDSFSRVELTTFFDALIDEYARWSQSQSEWIHQRDTSLQALAFPYSTYRAGQRDLAVRVYRTLTQAKTIFVEAPTGIGKTMAVLFPTLKALGEGHVQKIFYLTAKTLGREVAEQALADLRTAGAHVRSVTITARDKMCFTEGKTPCNTVECPYAIGYYDRLKDALLDSMNEPALTRETLRQLAEKHKVCPFEFSLDLSLSADVILCDYNYAFDPKVTLRRYFQENKGDYAFLVDESHNLVDRARTMHSATVHKRLVLEVKRELQTSYPKLSKLLHHINRTFVRWKKETEANPSPERWQRNALVMTEVPVEFIEQLYEFLEETESTLALVPPVSIPELLLELYFEIRHFVRISEQYGSHYVTLFDAKTRDIQIQLFCLDPAKPLRQSFQKSKASVLFSATLRPFNYFRSLLGGDDEDETYQLPSPFPPENLELWINDRIATTYRERAHSYRPIAANIADFVQARPGNYLVFFPSYRYLYDVLEPFVEMAPEIPYLAQTPAMAEEERIAFLQQFQAQSNQPFLGFVVMGGIFGEAIDLVGERLIGAVVVGVGLPQVCLERNMLRNYFQEVGPSGFDYAYTYPGMNKVLQAVGRVIRSEQDQGRILLIDTRFQQSKYQRLFPTWWNPQRAPNPPLHSSRTVPSKKTKHSPKE